MKRRPSSSSMPKPADNWIDSFFGRAGPVLRVLFEADGELHVREIARRAGVAVSAISVALRDGAEVGLLKRRQTAGMTFYAANERCPVYSELRNIVMMMKDVPAPDFSRQTQLKLPL